VATREQEKQCFSATQSAQITISNVMALSDVVGRVPFF